MSRTYRKAERWMDHYNGDLINLYNDVSLPQFPKIEEYFGENWHRIRELWGVSRIYKAVKVADVDNYGRRSCNSETKKIHNRIDRSRQKTALYKAVNDGEGVDSGDENGWMTSFDPWSYD